MRQALHRKISKNIILHLGKREVGLEYGVGGG